VLACKAPVTILAFDQRREFSAQCKGKLMQEFNPQLCLDQRIDPLSQTVIPHLIGARFAFESHRIRTCGLRLIWLLRKEVQIVYLDPVFRIGTEPINSVLLLSHRSIMEHTFWELF
jgi:hypothetical protein